MDNFSDIEMCLEQAIENGSNVKILLSNPECNALQMRASEYGIEFEEASARVVTALNDIVNFSERKNLLNKIEIRLYDSTAIFAMYSYGSISLITPYWREKSAIQSPQIEVQKPGYFTDFVNEHFDCLWANSKLYVGLIGIKSKIDLQKNT